MTDTSYYNLNLTNHVTFYTAIDTGDAKFYELSPAVKYGGLIQTSESINQNTTLEDNLTITAGDTLYVNAVYTQNDTIFVQDGGFIKVQHGGAIVLGTGGAIVYDDWSDCLVINQSTTHPKLMWQKYGSNYQYKIYRKNGTPSFSLLTTITSDTVTSFIDNEVTINFGAPQPDEGIADYYLYVGRASRTWLTYDTTNTARVTRVGTNYTEKQSVENEEVITEYGMEQNYPNPFNPTTTIRYQIPKDGIVTLKVYDILGREVKTLVNEFKTKGRYEVQFDANKLASGVYLYQFQTSNGVIITKKLSLLK